MVGFFYYKITYYIKHIWWNIKCAFKDIFHIHFDERELRWYNQRKTRGWDDRDLWDLSMTISDFIYPRLMLFKQTTPAYPGCPGADSEKEWDQILYKMTRFFKLHAQVEWLTEQQEKEYEEGYDCFVKYFKALWF